MPLYLQISESINREIAAGRYTTGDRLPPERLLAKQYSTTVRTLRKSLAELEKLGMLERVQGSGNYVREIDKVGGIYSMFRLELPDGGGLPTAQILDVRELKKPNDLPNFGTSHRATRVRRLRCLNQIAVAVEEIWLDRSAGCIDTQQLSDSLYRYYRQNLGFWIHRVEDRVSVGKLPDWSPDSVVTAASSSTFGFIERLSWAQDASPVEYSRTWFDPGRCRYVQRMK